MEKDFGRRSRYKKALSSQGGVIDIPCQVGCRQRSGEVREHTGQADNKGFSGHFVQRKRVFDGSLQTLSAEHFFFHTITS